MVNIVGNPDGSSAVDYTVNPATGFPWATGPAALAVPFNHLLPAWDAITGTLAATGLLAAERNRRLNGAGQCVRLALSDVAFAMIGHLGKIAEVEINQNERPKYGNYLYGAFGRDFATKDGKRVMVVGLTKRQWHGLVAAVGIADACAQVEKLLGVDLEKEGDRFAARQVIAALVEPWITAATSPRCARCSTRTGSAGGRTRPSPSWSPPTRAARRRTRCSPPSTSPASAPI